MKQILIYLGSQPEKQQSLLRALDPLHIRFTFLDDRALTHTLLSLLEHQPFDGQEKLSQPIPIDFMYFDEVSDDEIKMINVAMREQGITMPMKAVRTVHNEAWLLKDLLAEIQDEHEYFQILESIHKQLQASASYIIEDYTQDSWSIYEEAFIHAYETLQKQSSKEEAKHALSNLLTAKEGLVFKRGS